VWFRAVVLNGGHAVFLRGHRVKVVKLGAKETVKWAMKSSLLKYNYY
jgi:hypothetical protein